MYIHALPVLGHVGVALLGVDAPVVLDILEGLVHQTSEAAIVTLNNI